MVRGPLSELTFWPPVWHLSHKVAPKASDTSLFLSRDEVGLSKRLCLCQPMSSDLRRPTCSFGACLMAQLIKNLPAVQETPETWVQSLRQEDPLQKGMATQSSILAWRVPHRGLAGSSPLGQKRVRHDRAANTFTTGKRLRCWGDPPS